MTVDVYNELNDFIKNGTVAASIYQNHFEQAKKAMEVMCKYLIENVIENSEIYVAPEIVMKNNLILYE